MWVDLDRTLWVSPCCTGEHPTVTPLADGLARSPPLTSLYRQMATKSAEREARGDLVDEHCWRSTAYS
jgi:hypothetical protein